MLVIVVGCRTSDAPNSPTSALAPTAIVATGVPAAAPTVVVTATHTPATGEQKLPSQGAAHIETGAAHPAYNSKPATSGWHYQFWAEWGAYDQEVPDEVLVHNLEHAGIRIHYSCPDGCDDLVAKLKPFGDKYEKIIVSPYPGLDTKIALAAWTYLDKFNEFDEARIAAFIDKHMNSPEAPEPFVR